MQTPAFFWWFRDTRRLQKQAAKERNNRDYLFLKQANSVFVMGRKSISKTPFSQRLSEVREALGYESRAELAADLEMNPETLGGYERGDSLPDLEFMSNYSQRFSVNLHWLMSGKGEMFMPPESAPAKAARLRKTKRLKHVIDEVLSTARSQSNYSADMVRLPQYDVAASAGVGLIAIEQMPVGEVAFDRALLRTLGGQPDYCFLMWSSGPSMLPTIADNALLVVDSSQTVVDHGRIYVFNVGPAVLVKRARWRMDGRLELTSDNSDLNFPTEVFDADRIEDLVVVGRVLLVCHAPS